jgi:hypothetical protein
MCNVVRDINDFVLNKSFLLLDLSTFFTYKKKLKGLGKKKHTGKE